MKKLRIVFKFDDFFSPNAKVRRIDRFIRIFRVKITWGIIGKAAEQWSNGDVLWAKRALASGCYHFWNHGYTHESGEFSTLSPAEAVSHIKRTENVVRDLLGVEMQTFGAPCNAFSASTARAVRECAAIRYWFFGDKSFDGCLMRGADMEWPCGNPSLLKCLRSVRECHLPYVVLQGHPNGWGFSRRVTFYLLVIVFRLKGYTFCFPNEVIDTDKEQV